MKNSHCFTLSILLVPLCAIFRLLQHLFVIDQNGYFVTDSIFNLCLSYSVYAIFIIAAIYSLAYSVFGTKKQITFFDIFGGKSVGYLCLVAAFCIIFMSGIRFGTPAYGVPNALNYALCISGVLTSIGIALYGIGALSNGYFSESHMFGVFTPIYFLLSSICEFYSSFERAHKSETKIYMIAFCALCLFMMSFCLLSSNSKVTNKRLISSAVIYVVTATPITIIRLPFVYQNLYQVVESILHTALVIIALTVIYKSTKKFNDQPKTEGGKIMNELEKFLADVEDEPEDARGNNE